VRTRYKKVVGSFKDIQSDFYSNDSPNDDLDFRKALRDALIHLIPL